MFKNPKLILTIFILAIFAAGGIYYVQNMQKPVVQDPQTDKQPEVITSDIDVSDWITYSSDIYGYSLKLPTNFIFVDEYYGEMIQYNPGNNFFVISDKTNENETVPSFGFTVEQIDIENFITRYNNESKKVGDIVKLFSNKEIDYYDKRSNSDYPLPRILYHNSVIIELGGAIDKETLKAISKSVEFRN